MSKYLEDFCQDLYEQAKNIVPSDLSNNQKEILLENIKRYLFITGESLINNHYEEITDTQAKIICQVIAEWTFNKGIDLCRAGIPIEYFDAILQKINYKNYEYMLNIRNKTATYNTYLSKIENLTQKTYKECLNELLDKKAINKVTYDKAIFENNIEKLRNPEIKKNFIIKFIDKIFKK